MRKLLILTSVVLVFVAPLAAWAQHDHMGHGDEHGKKHAEPHMDFASMVEHYAGLSDILAADSVDGVAGHASALRLEMGFDEMHSVEHELPATLAGIEKSLLALEAKQLNLVSAREAFKSLSADLLPLVESHYSHAEGEPNWGVFHCPMAPGSWVQAGTTVANPYYGAKMLRCGRRVASLGVADEASTEDREHDSHADGHKH